MSVQPLPPRPIIRQLRFLIRVAEVVPRLLSALQGGHVEASQRLGRRRLPDGREVELWLVAKAPRRDEQPLLRPQR